jgi:hypothetical protein
MGALLPYLKQLQLGHVIECARNELLTVSLPIHLQSPGYLFALSALLRLSLLFVDLFVDLSLCWPGMDGCAAAVPEAAAAGAAGEGRRCAAGIWRQP